MFGQHNKFFFWWYVDFSIIFEYQLWKVFWSFGRHRIRNIIRNITGLAKHTLPLCRDICWYFSKFSKFDRIWTKILISILKNCGKIKIIIKKQQHSVIRTHDLQIRRYAVTYVSYIFFKRENHKNILDFTDYFYRKNVTIWRSHIPP